MHQVLSLAVWLWFPCTVHDADAILVNYFHCTYLLCVCVLVHACSNAHVEVRRKLMGADLTFYHVGHRDQACFQAWQHVLLPPEHLVALDTCLIAPVLLTAFFVCSYFILSSTVMTAL